MALVGVAVAGCMGGGDAPAGSSTTQAPPGRFDEETGAIEGRVLDPELTPVEGAQLLLRPSNVTGATASDGAFSFSFVAPGNYTILVSKLGFETSTRSVDVAAGESTRNVQIQLVPIPVEEPRRLVYDFKGFVTCSIGNSVVLSEECGEGLQTDVGTFGRDANNKIDWKFNITNTTGLQSVYVELWWKPASPAADEMSLNLANGFKCTPSCAAKKTYCRAFDNYGKPTLHCELDREAIEAIKKTELPYDLTARAWAAPAPPERTTLVYQQSFFMYRTEFYNEERPEGYTAVKDS